MPVKVLIVDDEVDILESTAMLIETLGLQAVTIADSSQIIAGVAREKPDIILQDLRMPGLDVSRLVAMLRSNPATAGIPLVFFSANPDLATTAALYDVSGYLAKPFDPLELAHLLQTLVGSTERPTVPVSELDLRRDVEQAFHDYWNLLAAQSNYISILKNTSGLAPNAQMAVQCLDELLIKIETRTDQLRSLVMARGAEATRPVPPEEGAPANSSEREARGANSS